MAVTFDETKHRRAQDGKFASKPVLGASAASTADVSAAAMSDDERYEAIFDEVNAIAESGEGSEAERVERMVQLCSDPSVLDLENPQGCDGCDRSMLAEPLSAAGYDFSTAYDGAGDPDVSCCPACTLGAREAEWDARERAWRMEQAEDRLGHALPLGALDEDTRGLIDRRFGFSTGAPTTLDEEAARYGVERTEIRRREADAMRTLREKGRR